MAGQLQWGYQGDTNNAFIVQSAIEKKLAMEVRDSGAFMDMEVVKVEAPDGNGMQDAKVDVSGTGAVWTRTDLNGDEVRFSLARNIGGEAGYGDSPVRAGDNRQYLHYNLFINEIDSELLPIPGRNAQRRIKSVISDFRGPTIQAVLTWHKEEKDFDFHTALIDGQDYGQGLSPNTKAGALGKDLGLGVGVGAPHEIFYTPLAGATRVTVPSNGPRVTAYRNNYIAALAALSADNSKFFTRQAVQAIAQLANDHKIDKVGGADWDYELVVDTAMMNSLMDTAAADGNTNLLTLIKQAQQGQGVSGQKSLDTRGAIVLDGIRIIPDKGMDKWRVYGNGSSTGVNAGSPVLRYGDGTYDRRNKSFTGADYKIGLCYLLGGGALHQGLAETIETIPVEDDFKKGWGVYGRLTRGVRRGFWEAKDGTTKTATAGWLQQSSIGFAFNIKTTRALA